MATATPANKYLTRAPRDLATALKRYASNTKPGEGARVALTARLAARYVQG